MPDANWSKDGKDLPNGGDPNMEMMRSPDTCRLKVKKAKRGDKGEYVLELKNKSGTERVPITIRVLGE